jgi:hypothetical protein
MKTWRAGETAECRVPAYLRDESYHLGAAVDGTKPKYYYPFGKGSEVYVEALKDAIASGPPTVAAYTKTS